MALPTVSALIAEYGDRLSDRRCACCGMFKLYAILYARPRTVAVVCSACDVAIESKR